MREAPNPSSPTTIATFTSGVFSLLKGLRPATAAGAFQTAVNLYAGTGAPSNGDGQNGVVFGGTYWWRDNAAFKLWVLTSNPSGALSAVGSSLRLYWVLATQAFRWLNPCDSAHSSRLRASS